MKTEIQDYMTDQRTDDQIRASIARDTEILRVRKVDGDIKALETSIAQLEERGLDAKSLRAQLAKLNGASKPKKQPASNGFKPSSGHRYMLKGNPDFKWDCVRGGNVPRLIREAKSEDILDKGPIPKDEAKPDQAKVA